MSLKSIFLATSILLTASLGHSQSSADTKLDFVNLLNKGEEAMLPVLSQPRYLPDESGLLFSWDIARMDIPANINIAYEIRFFELLANEPFKAALARKPIFEKNIFESSFLYEPYLGVLTPSANYLVLVDTKIQYPDKTEILNGTPNAIAFSYIPECQAPAKVSVNSIGVNNFTVNWSGAAASKYGYRYELRYREQGKENSTWTQLLVTKGNAYDLQGLTPKMTYELEIRRVCPPVREIPEMFSEWVAVKDIGLPAEKSISLPPFVCGDVFTVPTCNGSLKRTGSFDTLYIGGFPIEVSNISSNGLTWSGNGFAPLPFGNNVVKVEWTGLEIDTNGMVCSGTVKGISDDPAYYPDLDPGPIAFGGEICILPPSTPGFDTNGIHSVTGLPWDEFGFGPTGTYDKEPPYPGYHAGGPVDTTGTFDPWGFDSEGNFHSGGTVNDHGCTQEQLNSLLPPNPTYQPPPCNELPPPYEWLNTTGTPGTVAGGQLANEVKDSLEYWLGQVLDELESFYQDSIDIQSSICGGIRTTMNSQLSTLGYERKYIFGPDDEYFEEGMYKHFTQRPKPMAINMERNLVQDTFEANHIKLYDCDKKQAAYAAYLSIIDSLRNQGLSAFAAVLLNRIRQFNEDVAAYYSVHENLLQWLKEQSIDEIENEYNDSYGYVPILNGYGENGLAVQGKRVKPVSATPAFNGNFLADVSDGELNQAFMESFNTTPDDVSFQFRQGWQVVNGINRAYYLDAIAQRRLMANAMPMLVTEHDSTLMPIIVKNRASDGRLYQVYLDSIVFTPTAAVMNAYIVIELAHNGQKLVFESHGLTFGPTGFPTGQVSLQLGNDVAVRLSNAARLVILGNSHTYVSIDCQGFAGLGIDADVELCRNIVIPIDSLSGDTLPEPNRVHGHLQVFIPTWSELYVNISMDPFVVTGVEDIKWNISNVVFDYSETVSDTLPNTPPDGYMSPFAGPNGFQPEWKGVYIKNLSATLPNHFAQSGQPLTVGVEKVIIDDCGFSGGIYAAPLLSLAEGDAGGWAFSVDTFKINIAHNTLVDASFNGLINVPIFKNAGACSDSSSVVDSLDCFRYNAFIEPGNIYNFVVKPNGDYCVDMWKAGQVQLDACSSISMHLEGGQFTTLAKLSGRVTIDANLGNGMSINVPEIKFHNVEVSNKEPYFSPGNWEFPSIGADFGGFELTVNDLAMVQTQEGDPALSFGAKLKLSNVGNLTASGGFKIVGQMVETNGRQRWKFKEVKVNSICLNNVSLPGVDKLSGCINFYESVPTYGSGFRGQVDVSFTGIGDVKAVAQFGKVNSNKYFFIDALFCSDSGIPLGPVYLYGMGGGIYHNMTRPDSGAGLGGLCGPNAQIPTTIGTSISGITYTPSDTSTLGLKLTVVLGLQKKEAFNANATFEIKFSEGHGLSDVYVYGNAKFMDAIDIQGLPTHTVGSVPNTAKISANIDLHLNLLEKTFSGQLETYCNVGGVITGGGPNGLMTHAQIYLSPNNWYIKMGRPYDGQKNMVTLSIPGIGPIASVESYFQIGKDVDPSPPLPTYIAALTGLSNAGNFDDALGSSGLASQRKSTYDGFIFGASLYAGVPEKKFGPFRLYLNATLGFDVSMLHYGGVTCANTNGSQIGINGWYANGKIWASLGGGLWMKVKVFKKQKEFPIMDMQAAVALQAGLPNPFWAEGGAGISYNLLGGLVKGHCDFQVTIGERCEVEGASDPFEDVPIIATTTPTEGEEVTVAKKPFVNFNFPINKPFSIADFDGNSFSYKISLDYARIKKGNWVIPSNFVMNGTDNGIQIQPHIFLPRNDSFKLEIKVHVDSSGVKIHEEERIVLFTTSNWGYNTIAPDNVAGSYPLDGQYNFYKDELTNHVGYIQLRKGQPDLFYGSNNYQMMVRLKKSSGECMTTPMTYNALDYQVNFPLPTNGFFSANGIYKMELIKVPYASNGQAVNPCADLPPANPNPSGTTPAQSPSQPNSPGDGPPNNPPTSGPPSVQSLYAAYFRVSQYNTFYAKINAWATYDTHTGNFQFQTSSGFEPFDKFEIAGANGMKPLVEITAQTSQTDWFKNTTQIKALYKLESSNPYFDIEYRNVPDLGWPPTKAVFLSQNNPSNSLPSISSSNFSNGSVVVGSNLNPGVKYDATTVALADQNNIRQQVAYYMMPYYQPIQQMMVSDNIPNWNTTGNPCAYFNAYPDGPGMDIITNIISKDGLRCWCNSNIATPSGNFPVTFRYRLPGLGQYSSEKVVTLVKP